jgi:hypothetical protein
VLQDEVACGNGEGICRRQRDASSLGLLIRGRVLPHRNLMLERSSQSAGRRQRQVTTDDRISGSRPPSPAKLTIPKTNFAVRRSGRRKRSAHDFRPDG